MLLSLRKVTVANFRGVRDRLALNLTNTPSGLYFIRGINREDSRLGSNGAGKSTLFAEAFIWALTGKTSRSQRPSSDIENRTNLGKLVEVEVEIALDNNIHVISRSRNPNALILDGTKIEQQDLMNVLPLSEEAIRKSVLIDQFGGMFLSLRPEAKSQIFTETLSLDRWLEAADRAGDKALEQQRLLAFIAQKTTGAAASLAEARDQLETAVAGENSFEDERDHLLEEAKDVHVISLRRVDEMRSAHTTSKNELDRAGGQEIAPDLKLRREQHRRLQRAAAEAEARAVSTVTEVEKLRAELTKYRTGVEMCPECGQRVNADHIKQKRGEITDKIDHVKKLAAGYIADSEATSAELKKDTAALERLEESMVEILKLRALVATNAAALASAEREAKSAEDKITQLKNQSNPFTTQCDRLENRVKELRVEQTKLKTAEDKAVASLAIYQFWQKGFREIRLQQLDTALAELELTTNRHAEALGLDGWRIEFATERETKRGSVSHGFTVALYPPNDEEPVNWETYCGGEVQRWQLAVTFGLAEVLLARAGVSTDFEILDEPTTHISPEGISDLLECLSDRARELNRRIFLIDHNALDRGAFDGVVTVSRDAKRGTYVEDAGGVLEVQALKRERVML